MNLKFSLEDKINIEEIIDYFSFRDYPIIIEKLENDKKWINNKNFENFSSLYNKDLNFTNLPLKNNHIIGIFNLIQDINFIKVIILII